MSRRKKVELDLPVDVNPYMMWQGVDLEEYIDEEDTNPEYIPVKEIIKMALLHKKVSTFMATAVASYVTTRMAMIVAEWLFTMLGGKV